MRSLFPGILVLAGALVCQAQIPSLDDAGFLSDRFPLTLGEGQRVEMLGPLFGWQRQETETLWTFPPLGSVRHDTATDFFEFDFAYPLLTFDRFGLDYRLQLLQLFSFSGGRTMEEEGRRRLTLFPIYFHQRSDDPAQDYTAVVPFYGHLKNRFFRDEISFVMLPLWLQTRKRDVVTDNYMLPLFHRRRGDGLKGWQFWPLIGHETKEVTWRTDSQGEKELVGGHDKWFAFWPVFFRNDLGLGTTNVQTQRLFLPLYSAQRAPARDTTSYLWPIGVTRTIDRERKYQEWGAPWPLVAVARGEGKTLTRVWPLFSQGRTPSVESDFYLWPVYKRNRTRAELVDRQRTRILLFLYSDVVEENRGTGTKRERTDLWPLFTARREHNGSTRLQLLAPLEPLVPGNTGIERNYSPVWSIWRSEANAATGATSQSFLWNLFRCDTTPDTRKCSLLFGLFHYQSGPEGKRWRLFYVPIGKRTE